MSQPIAASAPADGVSLFGVRVPNWVILAMILAVTCLAYWPALSGGMLWDDDAHIPKPEMQSLSGLYRIWFDLHATQQYYPLLFSSFWLQFQLWGEHMVGYHIVNLALHLGAAYLVYLVLRKLRVPGALLATAIFALHPVHAESVAWVTEQKNTLSAVFYLGAMLAYLNFDESRRRSTYVLALGLFVAAVLSKTVAVTLPPALLVIFWWQRGGSSAAGPDDPPRLSWRRDIVPLIPFFAISALDGLLTIWVERKIIGAEGSDFEFSLPQQVLIAGRAVWFYPGKLIWPVELIFIYPKWRLDPAELWQWLFPLAAVAALVGLWMVRKRWRAPLAAALFFVGSLFPVLGFLHVYFFRFSFVADHFQYLASLGVIVLAAAGMVWALGRLPQPWRWVAPIVCITMVGTLATLTWRQAHLYGRDAMHLYVTTLEANPGTAMPHINMALVFLTEGKHQAAIEECEQALQLSPNAVEAHINLGLALLNLGRPQEAISHFEDAIKLEPNFIVAHNNLGNALLKAGRAQESLQHFEDALQMAPNFAGGHFNFGNALLSLGRFPEAIDQFEEALRLQPVFGEAQNGLGEALFKSGKLNEGVEHLQLALEMKPNFADAHNNLGNALVLLDRLPEAIEQFQEALRINPNSAEGHNNLGIALLRSGRAEEAVGHYQQALRLKPNYIMAEGNLGAALLNAGRAAEAIPQLEKTVRVAPGYLDAWINLALANAQLNRSTEAIAAAEKAAALARSQGKTDSAQQLEAWIAFRRDSQPTASEKPTLPEPPASPVLPPP